MTSIILLNISYGVLELRIINSDRMNNEIVIS